jgi:hypothetical protein
MRGPPKFTDHFDVCARLFRSRPYPVRLFGRREARRARRHRRQDGARQQLR